ncbi:MAG: GNAT family N-acetyltransferase [Actinobacteria bacterium HGW-Actinobacteria-6]|nr:MAG: GNAT family N-acetyltransferase [Actinobacteria bacterium HGW-Actinobacteria-6]
MDSTYRSDVGLRPWAEGDLPLLTRLLGDPAMTEHIGGPESPEKLLSRHKRYLEFPESAGRVFAIVVGDEETPAGWVGYWESEWLGQNVWETGWSVLPEFQGRGVATAATALMIGWARADAAHRFMHAFPSVHNTRSNAICRNLGFELQGEVDIEYPPGTPMHSNDWRLDLRGPGA